VPTPLVMAARLRPGWCVFALAVVVFLCITSWKEGPSSNATRNAFVQGGLRGTHRVEQTRCLSSVPSPSWMEVSEGPTLAPTEDATVMPVYPLQTLEWPGNTVEIKVGDPARMRMYQDLLEAGRRHIIAPFSRPTPAAGGEGLNELRMHSMGPVLYLEDLKVVDQETDGAMEYVATHKVVGRANILRLLNPSAFFDSNAAEANVSYLQAEVEVLTDPQAEVRLMATAKQLMESLEELRAVSERLNEPRLQSVAVIKQTVLRSSTWQLLDLWQRLQIASRTHRLRTQVHHVLREWLQRQQSSGRLPTPLPTQLNLAELDVPTPILQAYLRVRNPEDIELGSEFWDRLLGIFAASDGQEHWKLLLEWTREEVKLAFARASVHDVLG